MNIVLPLEPALTVCFQDAPAPAARFFEVEYGRLQVNEGVVGEPDIVVAFVDSLPQPRTWDSLGRRVMLADDALVVVEGDTRASITMKSDGQLRALVEKSMPLDTVRRRVVIPAISLLALRRDALVIHGSATRGPHGPVLLLGGVGVGKTGLLTDLVARGHSYIADDTLLLTGDSRLIALQGLLELRLDMLATRPDLAQLVRSSELSQTRWLRSLLRALSRLAARSAMSLAMRATNVLGRLDNALSAHCFFVDSRRLFPVSDSPDTNSLQAFLLTRGTPTVAEAAASHSVERWLLDQAAYANEPLFELMRAAAPVSSHWASVLEELTFAQAAAAASATKRISAYRIRMEPNGVGADEADLIARLAAEPAGAAHVQKVDG